MHCSAIQNFESDKKYEEHNEEVEESLPTACQYTSLVLSASPCMLYNKTNQIMDCI